MAAHLCIEPTSEKSLDVTVDNLQDVLFKENVLFGVNEPVLADAVRKWEEKKKPYTFENVAKGILPVPAKESDIEILLKHVDTNADVDKTKKAEFCWELADEDIPFQRVDTGIVIAKKEMLSPMIPGKDVYANDINTDKGIKTEIKLGENVEENQEDSTYKSLITGVVYFTENRLGVLPINFDGSAEVSISSDSLKADLTLHPALENGEHPSEETIRKLFKEENINFGINEELLSDILAKLGEGVYPEEQVTIAEGEPAEDGEDGKVEYLFNTETSLKPAEDAGGNVDYKNVSIIQSVKKGDELARVIPPTEGKPGKDINGNEIPCKEGTPAMLPVGTNTEASPEDENVLIAQTDGNVRLKGQAVEIYEGFIVKGDVDYSTGNINYDKSVSISGDIKSGFTVKCGGDLEVGGIIEDSEVFAGGSVLCKYGFVGNGKGKIESKGDVNVGFMKNQTIRSRSNVNIAKEALNCKIFARKEITVNGKSLSIAGGTVIARDGITCNVVGNKSGIQTILEVGLDFTLVDEMEKTENQMKEILENKGKLMETAKRFERIVKMKRQLPEKEKLLYAKLRKTIEKYNVQVKNLEERKNKIDAKLYDFSNVFIKIEHSAMPGTLFKIGERHYMVTKEIIGPKTVRMIDFEIRIM
jgi:uncharacterized protein (DUF342 family)